LSDDRVRELHARLTDAKRQVNDAGSVSMDGLARQLRAAEQDLRKRHGNRKIDFDVVIRDGKAVVKPKVK
jgi:glutamate mutase epsilon subunit